MGIYRRGAVYWYRITVNGMPQRRSLGTRDEAEAKRLWRRIRDAATLARLGLPSPPKERSIAAAVEDYVEEVRERALSTAHERNVTRTLSSFSRFLGGMGVLTVSQLQRSHAVKWLRSESTRKSRRGGRLAAATVNRSRQVLSAWGHWLELEKSVARTPFPRLPTRDQDADRRHVRRALTQAELGRLVATAPQVRGMAYLVAATTGLRRSELLSILRKDVDLERGRIYLMGRNAKNGKQATLPIAAEVVAPLRLLLSRHRAAVREAMAWPRRRSPNHRGEYLFPTVPRVRTMRGDLVRADVPLRTAAGLVDFHSLRHTFATLLSEADCSLQVAQRLMRHSDPRLTSTTYTQVRDAAERAAVDSVYPGRGSNPQPPL